MPLAPGSDQATISSNISELTHHGSRPRSHKQIVAIALANADRHPHAAFGGGIGNIGHIGGGIPHIGIGSAHSQVMSPSQATPFWTRAAAHQIDAPMHGISHMAEGGMMSASQASPWTERADARIMDQPFHGGLIGGSGAGRTDRLPLSVGAGSHVIPSDVTSAVGQGASNFGANALQAAMRTGPYGVPIPKEVRGHGPPAPPHIGTNVTDPGPTGIEKSMMTGLASGGEAQKKTSILAASSEFVVPPEDVIALGERGIRDGRNKRGESPEDVGHRLLDEMIARVRKYIIKWLEHAPDPKK